MICHTLLRIWMMSPSFRRSSSSFVASKVNVTLQYSFAKEKKDSKTHQRSVFNKRGIFCMFQLLVKDKKTKTIKYANCTYKANVMIIDHKLKVF